MLHFQSIHSPKNYPIFLINAWNLLYTVKVSKAASITANARTTQPPCVSRQDVCMSFL